MGVLIVLFVLALICYFGYELAPISRWLIPWIQRRKKAS